MIKIHNIIVNEFDFEEIRAGTRRFVVTDYNESIKENDYVMFNNSTCLFKILHIYVDFNGKILNPQYCIVGFKMMEMIE